MRRRARIIPEMRSAPLGLVLLSFGACAIPNTVDCLSQRCPPPELGRPAWVRGCAGTGAWIGGIAGGLAAIVLLPIDYPLSLLAGDQLGEASQSEFLWWPALGGAAVGHALLGGPTDVVDWVFRRAWVDAPDATTSYEYVPLPGPEVPKAAPAASGTADK